MSYLLIHTLYTPAVIFHIKFKYIERKTPPFISFTVKCQLTVTEFYLVVY